MVISKPLEGDVPKLRRLEKILREEAYMLKKRLLSLAVLLGLAASACPAAVLAGETEADVEAEASAETEAGVEAAASEKSRMIITQDGEVDDMNSLIHTLLYANDIDIEGIVQTSSTLHYSGDESNEAKRWMGTDWMYEYLDAYAEVYENLKVHSEDYPSPDELRAVTVVGNVAMESDTSVETEGSELIKERILAEDDRKLYIVVGGGANTVARALMSIEEAYQDTEEWETLYQTITEKVVLYAWGKQDSCYKDYISVNWPKLQTVDVSGATNAYGYKWAANEELTDSGKKKLEGSWMYENLLTNHGALLDKYVTWGDGTHLEGEDEPDQYGTNEAYIGSDDWWGKIPYNRYDFLSEGDSPAWMAIIPTGLRNLEDVSYGGWGGRYVRTGSKDNPDLEYYEQAKDEAGMARWVEAIQEDFAARADWCVTPVYEDANHAPTASVAEGLEITAEAGQELTLHGETSDPDGDEVTCIWSQYCQADTYEEETDSYGNPKAISLEVNTEDSREMTFVVPEDAKSGDTIHILLEARDSGVPHMRCYQRVIVTVK